MVASIQKDVLALYESSASAQVEAYRNKTRRQKYAESKAYINFKQVIFVRILHSYP